VRNALSAVPAAASQTHVEARWWRLTPRHRRSNDRRPPLLTLVLRAPSQSRSAESSPIEEADGPVGVVAVGVADAGRRNRRPNAARTARAFVARR
jgi:hypothetical protein